MGTAIPPISGKVAVERDQVGGRLDVAFLSGPGQQFRATFVRRRVSMYRANDVFHRLDRAIRRRFRFAPRVDRVIDTI
jgi:hypothetical protein